MRRLFGLFLGMTGQDTVLVGERLEDLPADLKIFPGERCDLTQDFRLLSDECLNFAGLWSSALSLGKGQLTLFCKFTPAFPYLTDTVETFFCIREHPEVLLIKFAAVPALEDEIDLCFLDNLVFSGGDFLHSNTFTKSSLWEKRIVVRTQMQHSFHKGRPASELK